MSDTVITVENLSKTYLVGHKRAGQGYKRYETLRDIVGDQLRNIARHTMNVVGRQVIVSDQVEEFWALQDVSFEVKRARYWRSSDATEPARALSSRF